MSGEWKRFRKGDPCPICESTRRCSLTGDGLVWCVKKGGAAVPGWRVLVRSGEGGSYTVDKHGGTMYAPEGSERPAPLTPEEREARRAEEEKRRREERAGKVAQAVRCWDSAAKAKDHHAARAYLAARGVPLDALPAGRVPEAIRFVARAPYYTSDDQGVNVRLDDGPALYCEAVGGDGTLAAVQRIYLDVHGAPCKRRDGDCVVPGFAGEACAKKAVGAISGAAVRLGGKEATERRSDEATKAETHRTVHLAEGVETACMVLAAMGEETWSCVSAGGLNSVEFPAAWMKQETCPITRVVVWGDHDAFHEHAQPQRPGQTFARLAAGRVRTLMPWVEAVVMLPDHVCAPDLLAPGPSKNDEYGEIIGGGKSVDWLDVGAKYGVGRLIEALAKSVGGSTRSASQNPPTSVGGSTVGGSTRGSNSSPPSPPSPPSRSSPPSSEDGEDFALLPPGELARAREALSVLWAWGDDAGGRAGGRGGKGERWKLAYFRPRDKWMEYVGTHYRDVHVGHVSGILLQLFSTYRTVTKDGAKRLKKAQDNDEATDDEKRVQLADTAPANFTVRAAGQVVEAMKSECEVHGDGLPVWAPATFGPAGEAVFGSSAWPPLPVDDPDPDLVIPYKNGLLSVEKWRRQGEVELRSHTSRYVCAAAMKFELPVKRIADETARDPAGEELGGGLTHQLCPNWINFLTEVSGGDPEWIVQLQMYFGLCLTFDMLYETSLWLTGPPGSGKGTVLEALTAMLGERAIGSSSLNAVTRPFELAGLVHKNVVIFDEAAVGHTTDSVEAARRLKTIIGGFMVASEAKFGDRADVRPVCRLIFAANELPKLQDNSAAMARRMVILPFTESFEGREDIGMKRRIMGEAAGIAVWGLFGLRELFKRGRFKDPETGAKVKEDFRRLSSPALAFARDCLVFEPGSSVYCAGLRELFKAWAEAHGNAMVGEEKFGAGLRAVNAHVVRMPARGPGGARYTVYRGVRPRLLGDGDETDVRKLQAVQVVDTVGWGPFEFEFPKGQEEYGDDGALSWRATTGVKV